MNSVQAAYLGIRRSRYISGTNFPIKMDCFIQDQQAYHSLPLVFADMQATMIAHSTLFPPAVYTNTPQTAGAAATFYRFYEVGLVDWLAGGTTSNVPTASAAKYYDLIGGSADANVLFDPTGSFLINAGW